MKKKNEIGRWKSNSPIVAVVVVDIDLSLSFCKCSNQTVICPALP